MKENIWEGDEFCISRVTPDLAATMRLNSSYVIMTKYFTKESKEEDLNYEWCHHQNLQVYPIFMIISTIFLIMTLVFYVLQEYLTRYISF